MPVKSLQQIFDDYETNFVDSPAFVIKFVELNPAVLAAPGQLRERDDLLKVAAIVGKYFKALMQTKQYQKVVNEVDLVLTEFDANMRLLKMQPNQEKWYLHLMFFKGEALYNLNFYKNALDHFNQMLVLTPDNAIIKKWIFYSKTMVYKRYHDGAFIIGGVLIIGSILLVNYFHHWINAMISFIGLALVLYTFAIKYIYHKNRKADMS
ncbi:hypothetical protein ABDD95_03835 [Mucilaginibacter sp. PAMB04274]|uniref:hypothetical protein n=1 Tax=Mucilaginibacter sp. PAMB04274 TaxID=3138568 RepID=UPI0031F63607